MQSNPQGSGKLSISLAMNYFRAGVCGCVWEEGDLPSWSFLQYIFLTLENEKCISPFGLILGLLPHPSFM